MVRARKATEPFSGQNRLFAAQVDEVPTLRVSRRPQSSRHSFSGKHEFRMLPPLSSDDLTDAERKELLSQKLLQCTYVYDFLSPNENLDGKEAKQRTLSEILEYMTDRSGIITFDMYPKLFKMVSANLFRTVPPQINAFGDPFDPEEDEPREEPAWPHLCLVYHIFLRFLESPDFNNSAARPYIDHSFTIQLLELFDCEDVRERESLKTVLHRIYGKMLGMRSFIRRSINNIFLQFIYESQRHNGIAELLEILGSIINGFTVPLKDEHISFLHRVLLPLHKARPMTLYYAQLAYCTVQFLEKDPALAEDIIKALLRYWPKVNSPKEVMFVNELEGIMDAIEPTQFAKICQPLFEQLIRCVVSPHFQIAERTLAMWRNAYFANLITDNIHLVLPIALSGIYRHSRSHWNRNIHNQVYQILRFFVAINEEMFEQCLADFRCQRDQERNRKRKAVNWWSNIEKIAIQKSASQSPHSAASDLVEGTTGSALISPTVPLAPVHVQLGSPATAQPDVRISTSPSDDTAGARGVTANGDSVTANGLPSAGYSADNDAESQSMGVAAADHWSHPAGELPMSKLDDPDTMCCDMDEDEFIQELDKFVDIIKAEDPETALAGGMMLLDESDGSLVVDDLHGVASGSNAYAYGQHFHQHQHQFEHLDLHQHQQRHAGMLHGMGNGNERMNAHMILDPSSMQIDYSGSIATAEVPFSIAPSLAHSISLSSEAQMHRQLYVGSADSDDSGSPTDPSHFSAMRSSTHVHGDSPLSPIDITMTSAVGEHNGRHRDMSPHSLAPSSSSDDNSSPLSGESSIDAHPAAISPILSGVGSFNAEAHEMAAGSSSMDAPSTPPPAPMSL
ncbi:serine/threonine-protein phosphatase 2A 56 kDa regulatory subunit delta isoform [Coemansia thaxteri]|uniref:Serine/threonine-protein phosphatase 2A 56 kDa regulatory subunit delta isoform n=1 Tax=Coemansia thaxteri TaxID=2663907 RepID=A0A9W8EK68_9FUNG|nr:serine/threonine-protein phosphatase 2A 56 kDa regulatory subunit delta isoform [Coemansia thaxteri]KAJ2007501.1 serine/threonine-protein phosphatase 2A 56 kDa regulatory subunit delta isoform [Coemansia thaxteri]KAJ2472636.1 serine/threonine-protein phosphatase 2A 56 kDa regulatory subunit delta isoform [Coemansia sp. RSA 2322]KAJ2487060.1 serine/threonine-protein phosphatase 2A 56 kDa regulatory subunit delta isoform [Coemansia sp. RSA 2320]